MQNDESKLKLSIEELRQYEGCEKLSEQEAILIIDGLYRLSQIFFI